MRYEEGQPSSPKRSVHADRVEEALREYGELHFRELLRKTVLKSSQVSRALKVLRTQGRVAKVGGVYMLSEHGLFFLAGLQESSKSHFSLENEKSYFLIPIEAGGLNIRELIQDVRIPINSMPNKQLLRLVKVAGNSESGVEHPRALLASTVLSKAEKKMQEGIAIMRDAVSENFRSWLVSKLNAKERKWYEEYSWKKHWFQFLEQRSENPKHLPHYLQRKSPEEVLRRGSPVSEMILGQNVWQLISKQQGHAIWEKIESYLTLKPNEGEEVDHLKEDIAIELASSEMLGDFPLSSAEAKSHRRLSPMADVYLKIDDSVLALRAQLDDSPVIAIASSTNVALTRYLREIGESFERVLQIGTYEQVAEAILDIPHPVFGLTIGLNTALDRDAAYLFNGEDEGVRPDLFLSEEVESQIDFATKKALKLLGVEVPDAIYKRFSNDISRKLILEVQAHFGDLTPNLKKRLRLKMNEVVNIEREIEQATEDLELKLHLPETAQEAREARRHYQRKWKEVNRQFGS